MDFRRSLVVCFLSVGICRGQTATICGLAHPGECLKDVVKDQTGIWTSPLRAKKHDAAWLLPVAGVTALAFHFDVRAENALGTNQRMLDTSRKVANFGSPYATAGGAVGLYFVGLVTRNEHLRETGRLGTEAVVDAGLVAGALKLATDRQRLDGTGQSAFWPNGTKSFEWNSSFPSGHAAVSWAMARVAASEYPKNKAVQVAAYAFATVISVSRVTGRAHFPSDVVVGIAFGYLIGGYVTRHRASESTN